MAISKIPKRRTLYMHSIPYHTIHIQCVQYDCLNITDKMTIQTGGYSGNLEYGEECDLGH